MRLVARSSGSVTSISDVLYGTSRAATYLPKISKNQGYTRGSPDQPENLKIRAVFSIEPENFRAVLVENLYFFSVPFFLVQLENLRAVTMVLYLFW